MIEQVERILDGYERSLARMIVKPSLWLLSQSGCVLKVALCVQPRITSLLCRTAFLYQPEVSSAQQTPHRVNTQRKETGERNNAFCCWKKSIPSKKTIFLLHWRCLLGEWSRRVRLHAKKESINPLAASGTEITLLHWNKTFKRNASRLDFLSSWRQHSYWFELFLARHCLCFVTVLNVLNKAWILSGEG